VRKQSSLEVASGWGPFSDTVLHFRSIPAVIVDLRREVDEVVRSELRRIGFERSFGVISAENPMGEVQTTAVNTGLAARLQRDTAELTAVQSYVDACSPDGSHRESSVAIALDLQSLIELATRHDQLAIFWFDSEAFWIVPVRSSKAKLRLPIQT